MSNGEPGEAGDESGPAERALVAQAEGRRAVADAARAAGCVELPLRFWRQHAHLTVPASDGVRARKAVAGGTEPAARQTGASGRYRRGAGRAPARRCPGGRDVALPRLAPLVVLDGEDAQAPGADVAAQGRHTAVRALREAGWSPATLRFYRPLGLNAARAARDLIGG